MKVYLIGGFLGAGKTTLIRALARHLDDESEQVAVITNDQGHALVDTRLCSTEIADVTEITGGCFCCRFDDLEVALVAAEATGATVAIAEAVGSCTDLIATVLSPLSLSRTSDDIDTGSAFDLAPLAVVVDPWRVRQVTTKGVPDDISYLFRKQIEEADIILISRSDLDPPDMRTALNSLAPDAALVDVSGLTGAGIAAWLDAEPKRPAALLDIDYERYAAAEALLGWSNGVVHLSCPDGFDPARVMLDFLSGFSDTDVAHVKMVSIDPVGGSGSLVRRGSAPVLDAARLPSIVTQATFLVNARVAMPAAELDPRVRGAMSNALLGGTTEWEQWECFEPSPPRPTHRHSFRCGTDDDASCCASFYDRPDVRYLLGDSWHPGGIELTLKMAGHLGLADGQNILDVACGQATSLRAVREAWPVETTGLDTGMVRQRLSRPGQGGNGSNEINFHQGDAHDIPFGTGIFDAVLCECALSTFSDQPLALSEMRRVLKKGGRLALSDMVVEGEVPESLKDWVNVGTCLKGALAFNGYKNVIEEAGFQIVEHWDASYGLQEMVGRIKRNLLGLALAKATGNLAGDVDIDVKAGRQLLREAQQAIDDGVIGYGVYIAERVD